ncbi:PilZ domain-containing protein [Deltaproteobacteria bacterium TL4]
MVPQPLRRRLYDRKKCDIDNVLIGPHLRWNIVIHDISLGGCGVQWNPSQQGSLNPKDRVRIELKTDHPHYDQIVLGGEVVYTLSKDLCGIKWVYLNTPLHILNLFITGL